jgi:pyruvate,water dikinase
VPAELRARLAAPPPAGDLEAHAAELRRLILEATEDHPLRDELRAACAELQRRCGDPADLAVAVRSSSVAEDGGAHSYAGEHDTHLWVLGPDEVDRRVRECWASLVTARALEYRRHGGGAAGAADPAMAVVVQQMAPARAAGVFMTLNPSNGDRSKVMIESVWGLGEPLVSGEVNPDRFLVDKITGEVVRRDVATKPTELVRDPETGRGTSVRDVEPERVQAPSLQPAEIDELLQVARALERRAGRPQDGEFAVVDGGVRLLQCRPETVWSNRPRPRVTAGGGAVGAVVARLTKVPR